VPECFGNGGDIKSLITQYVSYRGRDYQQKLAKKNLIVEAVMVADMPQAIYCGVIGIIRAE
jgi:hypothetical protein